MVRGVAKELVARLRVRAARNHRSAAEEHRKILARALGFSQDRESTPRPRPSEPTQAAPQTLTHLVKSFNDLEPPARLARTPLLDAWWSATRVQIRLERILEPLELSPRELACLAMLADAPARQAQLAARLEMFPAQMVGVARRLVGQGWVRRAPDPSDKRAFILSLTTEGAARLEAAEAACLGASANPGR